MRDSSGTSLEWHFQTTTRSKRVFLHCATFVFSFFLKDGKPQTCSCPLDDGRKVKDLKVHELVSALTGLGVPTASFPHLRADKVALLSPNNKCRYLAFSENVSFENRAPLDEVKRAREVMYVVSRY